MELSFRELQRRDVINVVDGKSLGRIKDLRLDFPRGIMTGIVVPGRNNNWFLRFFDRNKLFIPERNIIKIGGDVILVNINCGETCEKSVLNRRNRKPNCPPNDCKPRPPYPPRNNIELPNPNEFFDERIDGDDY